MQMKAYRAICAKLDFKRNPLMLVKQLLTDVMLLIIVVYLLQSDALPSYIAAQIILSVTFFRGFALMHEAVHHAIVRNKFVNETVGIVTGVLCFLPYESWKRMHLEHHSWAGNIEKDPVLQLRKNYDPERVIKNRIISKIWRSWIPLLGLMQTLVFWKYPLQQLRTPHISRSGKILIATSALVPLVVYTSLWAIWPQFFNLINFGPAVFLYVMMLENINAPHHLDVFAFNGSSKLPVLQQHLVTRTGYYPPTWIARFFFLNFNLHTEHHLFPSLPWYQLNYARPLVKATLGEEYNETFRNAWVRENRKKDLSDLLQPPPTDREQTEFQKAG